VQYHFVISAQVDCFYLS